jgi:hypothetical protein
MLRVLTACVLLSLIGPNLFSQSVQPLPVFKNGRIAPENSLLSRKISHPLWLSTRFASHYYVVVQLNHQADQHQKQELLDRGIVLNQWISGNNWLATCRPGFTNNNLTEAGIRNIYYLPPSVKLNPQVLEYAAKPKGPKDLIAVNYFSEERNMVAQALKDSGATIIDTKIKPSNTIFIQGSPETIKKIASLPFIISVNPIHLEDVPLNYNNRAIHGVQSLSATAGRNLTGKNVFVGIGDNADPSSHIDLSGKLIMRTDEPISDHGTHTSGTIAGGGILNPMYTGMAPQARLVVNDFSNILVNSPTYVADYNMPLTNNSYYNGTGGCPGEGEYNELSYYVDAQLLVFPKLLHVFAAGNDGTLSCSPFLAPFGTIKSGFQSAKNVLSVGDLNNVVYTISPASSCGPLLDGRIKPDIVAGGVYITSTGSYNSYLVMSGTSQSSPTVAGILALITERYKQLHGGMNPDGALLKALLLNNAVDLGNPGPDFTYGFGMVSARPTVEALEQNQYFTGSISNGGIQSFPLPAVPAGISQLKVLLYWPDAPALTSTSATLVNDLDLTVTEPGGLVHFPMVLDPSPANVNNNAVEGVDHLNNVEQVLINNPQAGNYNLQIKGFRIPYSPQNFYVTYEMLPAGVTVEYPFGSETWVPGQQETIRWSASGGEPNTFTLEYSTDGGGTWTTIVNAIPDTARSYTWTVPSVVTTQALIRITRNVAGYSDISDYPFTILGQPLLTVTNTCPGYARLNWNSVAGADAYDVMKLSGDTMQVIAHITDTSWLATPLRQDSSYWFSVRAVHGGIYGRRAVAVNTIPNSGACTDAALNNDLMLDSLLVPTTGRQFTSSQPGIQQVSIHVRNPGNIPTSSPITYSYQINGGPVVNETSATVIPAASSMDYVFSSANNYDFTAAGKYDIKTWIHYAADTIPSDDSLFVSIRTLRNDPIVLSPSFTEGFESALDESYSKPRMGLDSLDRADFNNSNYNGRLNTFFNSGFARTGNRSILLDVTENGTSAADSLITTYNLSGYLPSDQIWLDLYFMKQSAIPAMGGNYIWIRGNDQAAWIPVKSLSDLLDPAGSYVKFNLDVTGTLASATPAQTVSSSFQIKCGSEGKIPATSTNPGALTGGGISFDDFTLTNSMHDVAMRSLIQPTLKNICALTNNEQVVVIIKNFGKDTVYNIPVTYAINQDTVTEIVAMLAPKDSLQYSFIKTADMSAYQAYNIKTWVSVPGDNYSNNDSSSTYTIQTAPLVNQYPYLEGFETNNGYWYSGGMNDSWAWGKPAKVIIHKVANGSNAWVTSLTGNYNDNEKSYLYSPCFDLTPLTHPVLSFSHIFQTEDDCDCDFHWVEYTLDDSVWTILGNATTGVNWYDDATENAWQKSDPMWHVSSYDIPVIASKMRFRIVMYSDPGTNYEGVGIDDVHIFEKAPVFTDSLVSTMAQPVSGNNWIDFDQNGERIFSIQPNGQNLGMTTMTVYRDTSAIRDTAGQYYGARNWVVQTANQPTADVRVRYYFTDSEANKLIHADSCASCLNMEDAYVSGITQYSSRQVSEEDSTLVNNRLGNYLFHRPQLDVQIIPHDNGYYAETTVNGFSEFWINAGGKFQDHPLAAWLKSFTATAVDSTGLLNWSTWQEIATVKFIVEKSTDSIHFSKIGEVPAVPHADSIQSYQFTDQRLDSGNNYYMLILVDSTGDSLASPIKYIFYNPPPPPPPIPTTLQVYPNPTTGDITIKTTSQCREMQIFDVLGRKLLDKAAHGYVQELNIAPYTPGVYFLKLFTDSGNKLIKLQKR